ncbi:MAG: HDOD domain-containing protein [Proteobacteria bacterium]|nr:HDOD domain-containing protein [Pseudomonadota bacterium]
MQPVPIRWLPEMFGEHLNAAGYLTHAPMLDLRRRVVGYHMAWREAGAGGKPSTGLKAMVDCLAEHLNPGGRGWRLGRTPLFFDVAADPSLLPSLQALPPQNVVLCVGPEDMVLEAMPALQFMREHGYGLMLRRADYLPQAEPLRELITHFDVGAGESELLERLAQEQEEGGLPLRLIMTEAVEQPRQAVMADDAALQPESTLIMRLMQMLQRNEDVRQIETALKHDAVLTYRLLRHINSPAIGPGVEIQSLRHAVTMLGYSHLFRWLALLLATSNSASSAPYMTRKAIMRGRAVELLGKSMLTPTDSDNLFVVGMFSLIDQLLGVPMEQVLGRVQLAESVQQAILTRGGVYGPFLALAESCEGDAGNAARLSEDLFMSAGQVNAAQLSALVWSQEVGAAETPF